MGCGSSTEASDVSLSCDAVVPNGHKAGPPNGSSRGPQQSAAVAPNDAGPPGTVNAAAHGGDDGMGELNMTLTSADVMPTRLRPRGIFKIARGTK